MKLSTLDFILSELIKYCDKNEGFITPTDLIKKNSLPFEKKSMVEISLHKMYLDGYAKMH